MKTPVASDLPTGQGLKRSGESGVQLPKPLGFGFELVSTLGRRHQGLGVNTASAQRVTIEVFLGFQSVANTISPGTL